MFLNRNWKFESGQNMSALKKTLIEAISYEEYVSWGVRRGQTLLPHVTTEAIVTLCSILHTENSSTPLISHTPHSFFLQLHTLIYTLFLYIILARQIGCLGSASLVWDTELSQVD